MVYVIMTIQEYNKLLEAGKSYFEEVKKLTELMKKQDKILKEAKSDGD